MISQKLADGIVPILKDGKGKTVEECARNIADFIAKAVAKSYEDGGIMLMKKQEFNGLSQNIILLRDTLEAIRATKEDRQAPMPAYEEVGFSSAPIEKDLHAICVEKAEETLDYLDSSQAL